MIHNKAIFTIFAASRITNHETQIKKVEETQFREQNRLGGERRITHTMMEIRNVADKGRSVLCNIDLLKNAFLS